MSHPYGADPGNTLPEDIYFKEDELDEELRQVQVNIVKEFQEEQEEKISEEMQ